MDISEQELLSGSLGSEPLMEYPWRAEAERLILWAADKSNAHRAFVFDVLMSLTYIDAIPNLQKHFQYYPDLFQGYNVHLGFTNLCAPLLLQKKEWHFQKAAKPKSGIIGKLTSEILLKCLEIYHPNLKKIRVIGGTGLADAVLIYTSGTVVLGEVKASPLVTYPLLLQSGSPCVDLQQMSRTQVECLETALYMHGETCIPLGPAGGKLWPLRPAVAYLTDAKHHREVEAFVATWRDIRTAYQTKDRASSLYYLANASGQPPKSAREHFAWPAKESISDSKTSAGLDRTDDIKKGIYQTFKLSVYAAKRFPNLNIKTAILSNLPAYRHGEEYVKPFQDVFWANEESFQPAGDSRVSCEVGALRRPFDYIIALDDSFTREDFQ
jgi:hypothetical protein